MKITLNEKQLRFLIMVDRLHDDTNCSFRHSYRSRVQIIIGQGWYYDNALSYYDNDKSYTMGAALSDKKALGTVAYAYERWKGAMENENNR